MALQSQAPRSSGPRRYTSTGRRKKGLAPWLILLGLVVIVAGLIVLFSDSEDPTNPANANASNGATDPASSDPSDPGLLAANPPTRGETTTDGSATPPGRGTSGATATGRTTSGDPTRPDPRLEAIARSETHELLGAAKEQYETGMQRLESGDIPVGRALLSELLFRDGALPRHEAQAVRERLTFLNENTVFNKKRNAEQIAKDPVVSLHKVQSGEYLSTIGNTYRIPYQLIERINDIDARRLQAGQGVQVIRGPVHAQIDKSDYRMDLYVEDPDGLRIYLKSYTVGLGEFDSTPIGQWLVKLGSKVGPANGGPSWVNPRTGKRYDRNDPDIPIGEYWMALEGIDDNTRDKKGYGIHATNDPESIGRQESMGCIRMRDEDVDEVFYTLFEGASIVEIVP
ncbi:MAG: L,D-transpeptidase family protein [Phycisphaeraceae bacterium]|nr:L,D-transpeptidase family protein [Phycisphaeraceae bacterium]